MPATEIQNRVAERWRCHMERNAYRGGFYRSNGKKLAASTISQLGIRATEIVQGTRPDELVALQSVDPELHDSLSTKAIRHAEAILDGTWSLLGHEVDLTGGIDWHRDPRSDYRWERCFYADVPVYESLNGVDVKYVWELNRHQFLVELSRAWLFSRKEAYAERVQALLLNWIDENPLFEGVNWTSALEVAVRSIAWLWTLAALAEWPGWQSDDWARIARCLIEHATYLNAHLSFYSSPYNHLVGEATGLFLLGRWLRECDEARSWEKRGREVLSEFGPKQFHSDGFCVEQATGYHFFTLGFLVQSVVAARAAGDPLCELEPVVAKAFEAGAAFEQPDGRWPAIGDVDSARAIPVYPDDYWSFRSLCSLGAVVFGSPTLKETAERPGEELFWLLGVEGLQAWDELPRERKPRVTVLLESGYVVASSSQGEMADWLLFDAGPLAHGLHADATPSVAHGHADALQLLLFQDGQPLLVDSGMPFYAGDRRWVDHFRNVGAHNTMEVEEAPQARTAGSLAWSHVCGTPRLDANVSAEVWLIRGRMSLGAGVKVERNILGLPGHGVLIADIIQSDTPRRMRWYWQMPGRASARVVQREASRCEVQFDSGILAISTDADDLEVEIEAALSKGPTAWQAQGYGLLTEGLRVSCGTPASTERVTTTFIGPKTVPFLLEIRGRKFLFPSRCNADLFPNAGTVKADVIWHVETRDGPVTFAGGVSDSFGNADLVPLNGVGHWPAIRSGPIPQSSAG